MADATSIILAALTGSVLTGGGIYATVIRGQLTKRDHEDICEGKQALVSEKLDNIKEQQDKMDKKLDRLLFNNRPRPTGG